MIFSVVPSHAPAVPIRPPRRRYSSVSRANQIFCCARASFAAAAVSSPDAPLAAARIAPTRTSPIPPAAVPESTIWMRSPALPSAVSRSRACTADS